MAKVCPTTPRPRYRFFLYLQIESVVLLILELDLLFASNYMLVGPPELILPSHPGSNCCHGVAPEKPAGLLDYSADTDPEGWY